jgi:hypothetical protein
VLGGHRPEDAVNRATVVSAWATTAGVWRKEWLDQSP